MMVYRLLLRLYPHAFLRTFGDELEIDCEEGRREAAAAGLASLALFWLRTAGDYSRSLAREWLRTPWIPILAIAGAVTYAVFAYIAFEIRRWQQYIYWPELRPRPSGATVEFIVVVTVAVLIPIVGTILGSSWIFLLRRSIANRSRRGRNGVLR